MRAKSKLLFTALCFQTACSGDAEWSDPPRLQQSEGQGIATWPGVPFWDRNPSTQKYDINVCFFGDTDALTRQRAQDALTFTWEGVSAVNFVFQGTCPATPASAWMPIKLNLVAGSGGSAGVCAGGKGARLDDPVDKGALTLKWQCELWYSSIMDNFEMVVVHEVGHGLGGPHEHARSDYPGTPEGIWDNPAPAPGTTRDAWGCDRHTSGASNDPDGAGAGLGYHPVETTTFLTVVDPSSIMAPWLCDPNRRWDPTTGSPNFYLPSHLDNLGMEIRYPHSFAPRPRGRSGFEGPTQIVVRTDDTLVPAWSHRGAHADVFTFPRWRFGSSTVNGLTLAASSLGAGTHSVRLTFQDPLPNRSHDGTTTVRVNNALHAAIALTRPML